MTVEQPIPRLEWLVITDVAGFQLVDAELVARADDQVLPEEVAVVPERKDVSVAQEVLP
jgi:hypothetical protein